MKYGTDKTALMQSLIWVFIVNICEYDPLSLGAALVNNMHYFFLNFYYSTGKFSRWQVDSLLWFYQKIGFYISCKLPFSFCMKRQIPFSGKNKTNEPAHIKTYNKSCAINDDSNQPADPRSLIRVFADRMCLLQPPGDTKRDKREPWPYWVAIKAYLSFCWSHRSYCRFCRALAQILQNDACWNFVYSMLSL